MKQLNFCSCFLDRRERPQDAQKATFSPPTWRAKTRLVPSKAQRVKKASVEVKVTRRAGSCLLNLASALTFP